MNRVQVKTKKRVSGTTVAIITLSILLVASIAIGVTLAFFATDANVAGSITLGDPVNINITQGGASVTSLTFDGTALPGKVYDQVIGVSVPQNTSPALLRAKLTISNTGGATVNVVATTVEAWDSAEDGYYYYNGTANAGDAIDFVTAITVPKALTNEDANKSFNVDIIVEAIQEAHGAAREVWTTAPTDWLDQYSPQNAG